MAIVVSLDIAFLMGLFGLLGVRELVLAVVVGLVAGAATFLKQPAASRRR